MLIVMLHEAVRKMVLQLQVLFSQLWLEQSLGVQRNNKQLLYVLLKLSTLLCLMLCRKQFGWDMYLKILVTCYLRQPQFTRTIKLASKLQKIVWWGSNKAYQYSIPLLPSSYQVWRSQGHLLPFWANACWCINNAPCEVKFAEFEKSVLIQDTRLDQSGSVEDEATATRLVLKQAHAS